MTSTPRRAQRVRRLTAGSQTSKGTVPATLRVSSDGTKQQQTRRCRSSAFWIQMCLFLKPTYVSCGLVRAAGLHGDAHGGLICADTELKSDLLSREDFSVCSCSHVRHWLDWDIVSCFNHFLFYSYQIKISTCTFCSEGTHHWTVCLYPVSRALLGMEHVFVVEQTSGLCWLLGVVYVHIWFKHCSHIFCFHQVLK